MQEALTQPSPSSPTDTPMDTTTVIVSAPGNGGASLGETSSAESLLTANERYSVLVNSWNIKSSQTIGQYCIFE